MFLFFEAASLLQASQNDFNGDQIPDILWRNAVTGQVNLWLMKADGDHAGDKPLRENPDWTIAGTHDFNRDGIADILWRSTDTGQVVLWFMKNDGTRLGYKRLRTDLDWTVAGSDDFNGDQIPDILWRNAVTGQVNLWLMKADGDHAGDKPLRENPDWTIAGTHDFNRDGIADILWRSTDTGQVVLWFMKNDGTRLGYKRLRTDLDLAIISQYSVYGLKLPHEMKSVKLVEDGIFTMSPSGSYPAYRYKGTFDRTYFGYYSSNHCISLAYWNHSQNQPGNPVILWEDWGWNSGGTLLGDDHANPSVIVLEKQVGGHIEHNGKLLVAAAEHGSDKTGKGRLELRRSKLPESIDSWENTISLRSTKATYPRLMELADGRIWLLCRLQRFVANATNTFYFWESIDAGTTWSEPKLLVDINPGTHESIYVTVNKNAAGSKLHFTFNSYIYDNPSPGLRRYKNIYYICYDVPLDQWEKSDGQIVSQPLTLDKLDVVYQSDDTPGLEDWTYLSDIKVDARGNPVLVSINSQDRGSRDRFDPNIKDFVLYHFRQDGEWRTETVCETARFFYPNMATLHGKYLNMVFASPPDENGYGKDLVGFVRKGDTWEQYMIIKSPETVDGHSARPFYALNSQDESLIFWNFITYYEGSPYVNWTSSIFGCLIK